MASQSSDHRGCDPRRATAAGAAAGLIPWRSACPALPSCVAVCPAAYELRRRHACHAGRPAAPSAPIARLG